VDRVGAASARRMPVSRTARPAAPERSPPRRKSRGPWREPRYPPGDVFLVLAVLFSEPPLEGRLLGEDEIDVVAAEEDARPGQDVGGAQKQGLSEENAHGGRYHGVPDVPVGATEDESSGRVPGRRGALPDGREESDRMVCHEEAGEQEEKAGCEECPAKRPAGGEAGGDVPLQKEEHGGNEHRGRSGQDQHGLDEPQGAHSFSLLFHGGWPLAPSISPDGTRRTERRKTVFPPGLTGPR
jgi:hypothetical protein